MINSINEVNFFPDRVITRNGFEFNPNDDVWFINEMGISVKFNFNNLNIVEKNIKGLKKVFIWYLENHSLKHSNNMYIQLKNLLDHIILTKNTKILNIKEEDLINYRDHLGASREYWLGSLSGFLKKWYSMKYPGVNKSAYQYLNEVKFKGNEKGIAVLTMDPDKGPFTDLELEKIQSTITNLYAEGKIKPDMYVLLWLFMVFGSRPIQFSNLKVKDVISSSQSDGTQEVVLNIPRAKNRQAARNEFKKRIVPNSLSKLLIDHTENVKKFFTPYMKDPENAPLFPASTINTDEENDYMYHINATELGHKIKSFYDGLNIVSERTGKKMHITPIRFRRTIGTRLAQEGHGELIIAEVLDHTDTQNAGVYVQATPEILERIDKAVAMEMAPIAQAFEGKLVIDKTSVLRLNDSAADIIDPSLKSQNKHAGKCGSFGFCGLMAPLACYTCSSFQAWSDGPHEEILSKLIEERERLLETTDYRIASINDKTILAVAQVVLACREKNSKECNEINVEVLL